MRALAALALFSVSSAAEAASWKYWWYPGIDELLNMLAFAFWWGLVIGIAAIPLFVIYVIVASILEAT
jgi:hypothetical protein